MAAQRLIQDVLFSCLREVSHDRRRSRALGSMSTWVPSDLLPVLGRVPDGADRAQMVAHLAEAARLVRRRDIQMV